MAGWRLAVVVVLTGAVALLAGFLWSATATWSPDPVNPGLPPMAADAAG